MSPKASPLKPGHQVVAAITNPRGQTSDHNCIVIKVDGETVRLEVDLGGYMGRLWTTVDASCVKEIRKDMPIVPADKLIS